MDDWQTRAAFVACVSTQPMDLSYRLKDRIAVLVGPQRFKTWFKNATQFTETDGFLKVGVPNNFIGGWIERHYSDVILRAAREVLHREVQLTYVLDPRLSGNLRKTQLNSQAACVSRGANGSNGHAGRNGHSGLHGPTLWDVPRRLRGRLSTFVVGPSNRMAYNAALAVAEQQANAPSPLFLHGGSGLGKTHLLQGVANALEERRGAGTGAANWLYLSGEEFANQFLHALRNRELEGFRHRLRGVDALLLDDVHFLSNKKATQDEFLHTFNAIDMVGKRIVLASDAHPKMIGQISEPLMSRFVAGMVVRIDAPDHETRCNILRLRADTLMPGSAANRRSIPSPVIDYIADRVRSNVRELEGALIRVLAFASVNDASVTLHVARQALEDHASRSEPLVTAESIETIVATYFGMTSGDLHTSRKPRTLALARSIAMFLMRRHTPLSFPEIARFMGNKNHSTALLACRKIGELLDANADVEWQTPAGPKRTALVPLIHQLEAQFPHE